MELKPYKTEPEFNLSLGHPYIIRLNGYITIPFLTMFELFIIADPKLLIHSTHNTMITSSSSVL